MPVQDSRSEYARRMHRVLEHIDGALDQPLDLDQLVGSGEYLTTTPPGGRYAVMRFRGREDEIGAAWSSLLRDWLPSSGLQLDARPFFEYYPTDAGYDPRTGMFECDICVPVAAL
jgi:AraC family transcriptional regulator